LEDWGSSFRGWISDHTLPALTLIGLLFYGGTLFTYSRFYGAFGIEPEEAGVSYTRALARAAPAFFIWLVAWLQLLVLYGAVGVAIYFAFVLGFRLKGGKSKPGEHLREETTNVGNPDARERSDAGRWDWVFLAVCLFAILVLVFLSAADNHSKDLAASVRHGKELRPSEPISGIPWPWKIANSDLIRNPLRIRVDYVRVWPAGAQPLPPTLRPPNGATKKRKKRKFPYAYLGRSGDTIVLYNYLRKRTVRVPATMVVLSDKH
jgi:hypothetical protein